MNNFEQQEISPDMKIVNSLKFNFGNLQKDFALLEDLYKAKPNSEHDEGILAGRMSAVLDDPYSGIETKLSELEAEVDLAVEAGSIENVISELQRDDQYNLLIEYIKKYMSGTPRPRLEPHSTLQDIIN